MIDIKRLRKANVDLDSFGVSWDDLLSYLDKLREMKETAKAIRASHPCPHGEGCGIELFFDDAIRELEEKQQ